MSAYYNEHDPYAAQWLRNLITAGHIAPGEVDERSILDVKPDDLRGFTQCHFFAGIGVWSYALRRAGWPDDRPVWTGSCPCQPFSSAGMARGFADERHLWPVFHFLIEECRPRVVFGEQVASKDGLAWLDLVLADMEGTGYAVGAVDLCAAGFGAPHIRQRLWFVGELADADEQQRNGGGHLGPAGWGEFADDRTTSRMGDDDDDAGLEGLGRGHQTESGRDGALRSVAEAGEFGGVDDSKGERPGLLNSSHVGATNAPCDVLADASDSTTDGQQRLTTEHASPTNGFWRDADWLFCRDGKWRPVEPGTFPLAHGAPARVGRLRAYGNGLVSSQAEVFIASYLESRP